MFFNLVGIHFHSLMSFNSKRIISPSISTFVNISNASRLFVCDHCDQEIQKDEEDVLVVVETIPQMTDKSNVLCVHNRCKSDWKREMSESVFSRMTPLIVSSEPCPMILKRLAGIYYSFNNHIYKGEVAVAQVAIPEWKIYRDNADSEDVISCHCISATRENSAFRDQDMLLQHLSDPKEIALLKKQWMCLSINFELGVSITEVEWKDVVLDYIKGVDFSKLYKNSSLSHISLIWKNKTEKKTGYHCFYTAICSTEILSDETKRSTSEFFYRVFSQVKMPTGKCTLSIRLQDDFTCSYMETQGQNTSTMIERYMCNCRTIHKEDDSSIYILPSQDDTVAPYLITAQNIGENKHPEIVIPSSYCDPLTRSQLEHCLKVYGLDIVESNCHVIFPSNHLVSPSSNHQSLLNLPPIRQSLPLVDSPSSSSSSSSSYSSPVSPAAYTQAVLEKMKRRSTATAKIV